MMGLQDASRFVEYMPDDQLAREVQAQTIVPSYVALAEVARRNDMRNSQQNPPQPTVAESEVSQLMGSAGMSSNQPLSSPMGESPVGGGVPASGLRMMAEGGLTGYNEGGRSFMEKALDFRDPDGTVNWTKLAGTGLTAASLFSPLGLGARGVLGLAKGLPSLFRKGASLYNRKISAPIGTAAFKAMSPKMRSEYMKRMTAEGAKFAGKKSVPLSVLGNIVQKRAGLAGGLGALAYASGLEDGDINEMEGMDDTAGDAGKQPAGLSGNNVSGTDEASMPALLMAQLGFGLMGASNAKELAQNINSAISEYSARERQEKIDKSEAEERKARTAYYQAQAEGNTEQSIINEVNAINKALESGAMVESPELKAHIAGLLEQLSLMRGDIGMLAKNKKNPVEENRVG